MDTLHLEMDVTPNTPKVYIKLVPNDATEDYAISVEKSIVMKSTTLKNMIEDLGDDNNLIPIPLSNINSVQLQKIIEYFVYRSEHPYVAPKKRKVGVQESTRELDDWEKEYCPKDFHTLFNMILAVNFLDMKELLVVLCKEVATRIEGMTTQEIRILFNITNDFTPEEEEKIIKENDWVEK